MPATTDHSFLIILNISYIYKKKMVFLEIIIIKLIRFNIIQFEIHRLSPKIKFLARVLKIQYTFSANNFRIIRDYIQVC